MKKIKITSPIWNFKAGEIMEASEEMANFAIKRGRAELVETKGRKKKIEGKNIQTK